MSNKEHPPQLHVPVLLNAAINVIKPIQGESYLDLTAGYGGHARAFLDKTDNYKDSVLVDRDEFAISNLKFLEDKGAKLVNLDFVSAAKALIKDNKKFDIVFVDLGVSSPQLDLAQRGFSFMKDGPLDMRMDTRQNLTAEKVVNTYSEKQIQNIIVKYGEESYGFAARIAKSIVRHRPITTTKQLADLVIEQHRGSWQRTNPSTRTFQALRIAVNRELDQLTELLNLLPKLVNLNGRVGIISFHSLEDRIVKNYFKDQDSSGYEALFKNVTKKPLLGSDNDVNNPRSRSAKLRVALKIKK
jgi:16S rRNA (cytosine1402-N4)-methyltransferase